MQPEKESEKSIFFIQICWCCCMWSCLCYCCCCCCDINYCTAWYESMALGIHWFWFRFLFPTHFSCPMIFICLSVTHTHTVAHRETVCLPLACCTSFEILFIRIHFVWRPIWLFQYSQRLFFISLSPIFFCFLHFFISFLRYAACDIYLWCWSKSYLLFGNLYIHNFHFKYVARGFSNASKNNYSYQVGSFFLSLHSIISLIAWVYFHFFHLNVQLLILCFGFL